MAREYPRALRARNASGSELLWQYVPHLRRYEKWYIERTYPSECYLAARARTGPTIAISKT
jgi:hypothetical protein